MELIRRMHYYLSNYNTHDNLSLRFQKIQGTKMKKRKAKSKKQKTINALKKRDSKKLRIAAFAIVFAIIGVALVFQSFAGSNPLAGNGGEFHPISPVRLMDSRSGLGTRKAKLNAGETRTLQIRGVKGIGHHAVAATLNITAVGAESVGHIRVYPADTGLPNTSFVNFKAGQAIANAGHIGLSSDGKIKLYNGSKNPVHVIVDASGYYVGPSGANGLRVFRVGSDRVYFSGNNPIPSKGYVDFSIKKIKEDYQEVFHDIEAVEMNLVAINPSSRGNLTAYATGTKRPGVSSLNFTPGVTMANAVVVKVGNDDKIRIYNDSPKPVRALVDIFIAYRGRGDGNHNVHGKFVPLKRPFRAFDSRSQNTKYSTGILSGGESALIKVFGKNGVPESAFGAAVNLTTVGSTGHGYINENWQRNASLMNFSKGNTLANARLAQAISGGYLIYGNGNAHGKGGDTHLIVDVYGYFR